MTRLIVAAAAGVGLSAGAAALAMPVAVGELNGWDVNGVAMTETGVGTGVFEYTVTGLSAGQRQEWKPLSAGGDWGNEYYGGNAWYIADGAGSDITLTLDTNTYNDGWLPSTNRIGSTGGAVQNWGATGNWVAAAGLGSDWDNAGAPAMADLGGGVFGVTATIPVGNYLWKPVVLGSWDSVGSDNSTNTGSNDIPFSVTGGSDNVVTLLVNPTDGTVSISQVPAPGVAALAGIGGLIATRRRR
ncbi:MAG: hypothetical protein AAFX05_07340 [Planctomycetota bacterium]